MSDHKTRVRNSVLKAVPAPSAPAKKSDKAPAKGKTRVPYDTGFPEGCPVEPLGINGDDVFFLDKMRQLRSLKAEKLNIGTIRSLFGDAGDLKYTYWPRYSKPDEDGNVKVVGWRPEQAADALLNEASRRGIWDILDRVRGPGCWQDEKGELIMHCGDLLYHGETAHTPGQIGRHVYPSAPPKPHPVKDKTGTAGTEELLSLLKSWRWARPDVDPQLLIGWIGAAMLGGALDWRPLIWITGDKATGKSTLHKILKAVMGPGGLISSTDASAAGLWQTVGHASLPVALDEIEADQDNRKAQQIIKLARHAASGGQTLRGGSDHKNASFTVRSCFLFSSILIPPMLGQDVSRMAILQLNDLDGAKEPMIDVRAIEAIGLNLRGRILKQWHRLKPLLHTWKSQLSSVGHSGRSGDQFGTLMAIYDLLMSDHDPDGDTLAEWGVRLKRSGLAECEDDLADHQRCVSWLMSSQLDLYRSGEKRTVGSWIMQAAGLGKIFSDSDKADAQKAISNIGLLVQLKEVAGKKIQLLQVANDHQGLAALFKESHWAGQSGANGVWVQAFRRIKGNFADQQRFNGLKKRCTAVPLDEILGGQDE